MRKLHTGLTENTGERVLQQEHWKSSYALKASGRFSDELHLIISVRKEFWKSAASSEPARIKALPVQGKEKQKNSYTGFPEREQPKEIPNSRQRANLLFVLIKQCKINERAVREINVR